MLAVRRASIVVFTLHEKVLLTSIYKSCKKGIYFCQQKFLVKYKQKLNQATIGSQTCPNAISPGQNYSPQDEYKYCSEKM